MRALRVFAVCGVFVVLCVTSLLAGPGTLNYQGRLTSSSGTSVPDDTYSATFTLWDDLSAGTQIWSETLDIQTKDGLFSTELGSVNSFFGVFSDYADSALYLEVQVMVSGSLETITPRSKLHTAPYSVVTERVSGDIYTNNGLLLVRHNLGSSGQDGVEVFADDASSRVRVRCCLGSSGEDGVEVLAVDGSSSLRVGNLGSSGEDGVEIYADQAGTSRLKVNNLGSSGQDGVEIRAGGLEGPSIAIGEEGVQRCVISSDATADGRVASVQVSGWGGGGLPSPGHTTLRATEGESSVTSYWGLPSPGHTTLRTTADETGVVSVRDFDSDGIPDFAVASVSDASGARLSINTKGTGAKRLHAGGDCDDTDATLWVDCDDDDDGIADRSVQVTADDSTSAVTATNGTARAVFLSKKGYDYYKALSRLDNDSDDDNIPEEEIESSVVPGLCQVAIKTKGTGADKNRVITTSTTPDVAEHRLDADDDNDGVADRSLSSSVDDSTCSVTAENGTALVIFASKKGYDYYQAQSRLANDSDNDNIPEEEIESSVLPGLCQVAIKTKGTGADRNRVIISSTTPGVALHGLDADDDGDGVSDRSLSSLVDDSAGVVTSTQGGIQVSMGTRKGWDGTVKGSTRIDDGTSRMVELGSDGNGYFDNAIGVGMDPVHKIDVTGGAYCDGTNWVNASDAGSKENFRHVDGEELLQKILELEITKWNYKNDPSNEHIGPTAQDFQQIFGVGSDGRSISTIDPSGIALAAIKQLTQENMELKQGNRELQSQIDELRELVKKLADNK